MKTKLSIMLLFAMVFFAAPVFAGNAGGGRFQILGFGQQDAYPDYVIVYGKYINSGDTQDTCAKPYNFWYPIGTTHLFWFLKSDKNRFAQIITLSTMKANAYIGMDKNYIQASDGVTCQITHLVSQ